MAIKMFINGFSLILVAITSLQWLYVYPVEGIKQVKVLRCDSTRRPLCGRECRGIVDETRCGIRDPPSPGKIIGGQETDLGEFPFIVSLQTERRTEDAELWKHFCVGTLISTNYVLTTALCVKPFKDHEDYSDLRIAAGTVDSRESHGFLKEVQDIIIHPDFKIVNESGPINNDIALVRLKEPMNRILSSSMAVGNFDDWDQFTNEVDPAYFVTNTACLPAALDRPIYADDYILETAGWGKRRDPADEFWDESDYQSTRYLKKTYLRTPQPGQCQEELEGFEKSSIFCAAGTPYEDETCDGDAGAPVIWADEDRAILIGMGTSSGITLNTSSLYIKISHYVPWIAATIRANCAKWTEIKTKSRKQSPAVGKTCGPPCAGVQDEATCGIHFDPYEWHRNVDDDVDLETVEDPGPGPGSGPPKYPRFAGGAESVRDEFPYVVSIQKRMRHNSSTHGVAGHFHHCGGTIVHHLPTFILTAASCLDPNPVPTSSQEYLEYLIDPSIYLILAGTRNKSDDRTGSTAGVAEIYFHPDWANPSSDRVDLALLRTDGELGPKKVRTGSSTERYKINAACLPRPGRRDIVTANGPTLKTVGWGAVRPSQVAADGDGRPRPLTMMGTVNEPSHLASALMFTPPVEECMKRYPWFRPETQICATGVGYTPLGVYQKIVCPGDEGGPLIWNNEERAILVGVASKTSCKTHDYSMEHESFFSSVSPAVEWIVQTIKANKNVTNSP